MNNVMIDIETLSTRKNAAIISLGAVFFDIKRVILVARSITPLPAAAAKHMAYTLIATH